MIDDLCIFSYNSRGFDSSKQDFIKMLSISGGTDTVICNQENFVLQANEYIVRKSLPDHHVFFKAATKASLDGRPKNGMFIAVPEHLKEIAKDVSPPSDRLQSLTLKFDACTILLLNTYFPTDPQITEFDDTELQVLLAQIKDTIEDNDFDQLIWTGDMNTDFNRNSAFVNLVDEFIAEHNLEKSWDQFPIDFTHFIERNDHTFTSILDHFFWSNIMNSSITDAGVVHLSDNLSDHAPVYCKFSVPLIKSSIGHNSIKSTPKSMHYWDLASDQHKQSYAIDVERCLADLDLPTAALHCRDVHCTDTNHALALDELMLDTLRIIEKCIANQIPETKPRRSQKKQVIPDWKEKINPFREKAYFWHSVWISAGRPLNCVLHNIMKKTRNLYHLEIRKNKRMSDMITRNKLLTACLENQNNLFDEIKRRRKCKPSTTTIIDGHTKDIPSYLSKKYKELYNNSPEENEIRSLERQVNSTLTDSSMRCVDQISWMNVKACSMKLKSKKTDPFFNISSDSLREAPDVFYEILTLIFKSYISHGHVSSLLLLSTLIPIIKNKLGDITSSGNYRSIAISSLVLKIFDLVILSTFQDKLQLDELQFAYQSEVSTSMCTWTAIETINYFRRNGSDVYSCLMDMSKAFDTVRHSTLFKKLLDKGLPPIVVRYLMITYKNQKANVKWNYEVSEFFNITNGVKQGAILSAVLYCIYTDELFRQLRRSRIGCTIGRTYVGCLGYADDIFLLSPTIDGLQYMLKVCERFAILNNLTFSTDTDPKKSKTKCIAFTARKRELRKLNLSGNDLPWVDYGKHLGIKIQNKPGNLIGQDIREKRAQYIQRTNELLQEFSFASPETKCSINRIYNSHFTGSVMWDLSSKEANMVYNSWSTSVRKIFRLDRTTHRYFIEPISNMQHLKTSLLVRFHKFANALKNSRKVVVKSLHDILVKDCRSRLGKNKRIIELELFKRNCTDLSDVTFSPVPVHQKWKLSVARDLINARDAGKNDQLRWEKNEIEDTLKYVCTC